MVTQARTMIPSATALRFVYIGSARFASLISETAMRASLMGFRRFWNATMSEPDISGLLALVVMSTNLRCSWKPLRTSAA